MLLVAQALPLGLGDVLVEAEETPLRVTLGEAELVGDREGDGRDDGLKVKHVVELALPHGFEERPGEAVTEGHPDTLLLALVDALARWEALDVRDKRPLALPLGEAEAHCVADVDRPDETLGKTERDALGLLLSSMDALSDSVGGRLDDSVLETRELPLARVEGLEKGVSEAKIEDEAPRDRLIETLGLPL
jgi:hypothetical protein